MKIIKIALLVVVAAVILGLVVPPLRELRRVSQATADLEALSDAALRYARHMNRPCADLKSLVTHPGVPNWQGPYLSDASRLHTPWGGDYVVEADRGLVGIASSNDRVPASYRLGGIAELSMPIRENPAWWPSHAVRR